MSKTFITVERVNEVEHHPNADRLDIVQVLGYKVICGRDEFKIGDAAIYFPPDMLIPLAVADNLGVAKYLKHAIYPGDIEKTQCRVAACRLRGIPSHGFIVGPVEHDGAFGADLTQRYGGCKYEPPKRQGAGDAASEWPTFHRYTDIENIQRYPQGILNGIDVRITEKIHGTNCRIGLIRGENGDFEFMAGSHNIRRKPGSGLYWEPLNEPLKWLLADLCNDALVGVIVFGEIFGPGIQDLDYGQPTHSFRVFDISVNGVYLDWQDVVAACEKYGIKTVPVLYVGPFTSEKVEELTYGATTLAQSGQIRSKFKNREGCVVTPLQEQFSSEIGGRMILKSISADHRDRKGAQDRE